VSFFVLSFGVAGSRVFFTGGLDVYDRIFRG